MKTKEMTREEKIAEIMTLFEQLNEDNKSRFLSYLKTLEPGTPKQEECADTIKD